MSRVKSMKRKVEVEIGLLDDLNELIHQYFSDSDFDRDGFLAETCAELSVFLYNDMKSQETV